MSVTSDPVTFLELQTDLLSRIRAANGPADLKVAKRLLNQGLCNMHLNPGHKFPWAERRAVLITHAPYSTGTVSITTASSRTQVTGSGTLWTTATGFGFDNVRTGGKLKFGGGLDNYTVSGVTASSLTLSSYYVGDDLSGASYIYYEDEYALTSDFLRFVDLRMFSTDMNIPLVGRTDFRRWFPRNDTFQRPNLAMVIQLGFLDNALPRYRAVFHPVPDSEYQIPYWYVTNKLAVTSMGVEQERMEADDDQPIVPIGKRSLITLYAMYEYYRDYKDDARALTVKAEYEQLMGRIAGEMDGAQSNPQFFVRRKGGRYTRQRFDFGNRFDQIRDR